MIDKFEEFVNESEPPTPELVKSLSDLGKDFKDENEIIKSIEMLGFEKKSSGRQRTADHVFIDPTTGTTYISYTTGYVRFNKPSVTWRGQNVTVKTPITKAKLQNSKDRLLLILRRALKTADLYVEWKKSKKPLKEFIHSKRGTLAGKKFGL